MGGGIHRHFGHVAHNSVLIYGSWDHAYRAISLGDSTVDINLPTWPTKILFPFLFSILVVRLAYPFDCVCKAVGSKTSQPVAVPLIEDVATQTKREAETVSGLEGETQMGGQMTTIEVSLVLAGRSHFSCYYRHARSLCHGTDWHYWSVHHLCV